MPDLQQAVQQMVVAGLVLAGAAGLLALLLYLGLRPLRLLPRRARWNVPWDGWAVLLAFILAFIVPSIVQTILNQTRFFQAIYGMDFPVAPAAEQQEGDAQAAHLRGLWSQTIAAPIQFALIVFGLKFGMRAQLVQMGLSRRHSGARFIAGYLGWLAVTPIAFSAFFLAVLLLAPNPQKHPLLDLGPLAGRRELLLFILQAAILAPILEELVFRGVLLPWSANATANRPQLIVPPRYRPHVCYAAALFLCLQTQAFSEAVNLGRTAEIVSALAPLLFLAVLLPGYLFLPFSRRLRRWTSLSNPQAIQACYANGALFAAVHANVWPSPIPLFVLGIGLAWLSLRTRSIVPCITAHALFNGVAIVMTLNGNG